MEDIEIVLEFKRKVRVLYPEAEVYFYGSRARRTHHRDSDYDVLVLLKTVTPSSRKKIFNIAWEIGFEQGVLIVPVLSKKEEFHHSTVSPFYNNIKSHGIAI